MNPSCPIHPQFHRGWVGDHEPGSGGSFSAGCPSIWRPRRPKPSDNFFRSRGAILRHDISLRLLIPELRWPAASNFTVSCILHAEGLCMPRNTSSSRPPQTVRPAVQGDPQLASGPVKTKISCLFSVTCKEFPLESNIYAIEFHKCNHFHTYEIQTQLLAAPGSAISGVD